MDLYFVIVVLSVFYILFCERVSLFLKGPLKETCGHFWLMIWEQNSRAVIMLNRIIEKEQVRH